MLTLLGIILFYLGAGLLLAAVLFATDLSDDLDTLFPYGFFTRVAAFLLLPWLVILTFVIALQEGEEVLKETGETFDDILRVILNQPDPEDEQE